jgi:hypothetical protein
LTLRERGDPPTFRGVCFFQALDVDFVHHVRASPPSPTSLKR